LIWAFGFLAARSFEVWLRVDPAFTAGFFDYFAIGGKAVVPFALNWMVGIAVLALATAIRFMLAPVVKRFVEVRVHSRRAMDPKTVASLILVGGIVSSLVVGSFYWHMFASLFELQLAPAGTTATAVTLGPRFHDTHLNFSQLAAVISFVLFLIAGRWWPRPAQQSDVKTLRTLKWAAVTVAIVVMAFAIAPRVLAWDRFEVVTFENRPWCVIGTSGSELLLYSPDRIGELPKRVRKDAPGLVSTNTMRRLTN
jgi:hypothetical protein